MKRIFSLLCTLLCCYGVASAQNCASNFSASTTTGSLNVVFHDSSIVTNGGHITNWYWNFGDGSAYDTTQNPHHTYAAAGTYNVCLYIGTNTGGITCTNQHCDSVRVSAPACGVGFQSTAGPNLGQINFASSATGTHLTYSWSFGDGSTGTGANPVHSYTANGTYSACVYIESHDTTGNVICQAHFCDSVHVTNVTTACAAHFTDTVTGFTAAFTGASSTGITSGTVYEWTWGDTTTSGHGISPSHTYTAAGTYNVCLTIVNTGTACNNTYCHTVTIAPPCTSYFTLPTISGLTASFSGQYSQGGGAGSITYIWNFGDSTTGTGITPSHTYASGGTYNVCLRVVNTATHCDVTYCRSVTIPASNTCGVGFQYTQTPNGLVINLSATATGGHNFTYNWYPGDNTGSGVGAYQTYSHTYTAAGSYYACVYAYAHDSLGNIICTAHSCDTIHVTSPTTACAALFSVSYNQLMASFSAQPSSGTNSSTTYAWNFGDSTAVVNGIAPTHTYYLPGTYNVCLTISNPGTSCTNTYCHTVTVSGTNPNCSVAWTHTQNGLSTSLVATPTAATSRVSYTWTWGDGNSEGTTYNNNTHTYTYGGTYNVCVDIQVFDSANHMICATYKCDSVHVTGPASPTCNASFITTTSGTLAAFTNNSTHSSGAATVAYAWTFGDSTTSTSPAPTHTYAHSGTYNVCLTIKTYDSLQHLICSDNECHTVAITATPICSVTYASTVSGLGTTVTASTNSHNATYTWHWGDGTTTGPITTNPTSHNYTAAGRYPVCVTMVAHDSLGNPICSADHCDSINITPTSPSCQAYFQQPTNTSIGATFTSASTGITNYTTYAWTYGDSSSGTGATNTHHYAHSGTYQVCLTITTPSNVPGGVACTSTYCRSVSIPNTNACGITFTHQQNGLGATFAAQANGGVGGSATYSYSFGDNTASAYSSSPNATHSYANAGTYNVCVYLHISDSSGNVLCNADHCDTLTVHVTAPACQAYIALPTVSGNTVAFSGQYSTGINSTTTYTWEFGDSTTGTGSTPTHTYVHSGTYNVCLTTSTTNTPGTAPCISHYCRTVTITGTNTTCGVGFQYVQTPNGLVINLTASATGSNVTYSWNYGDGTTSGYHTTNTSSHTYANAGTYWACVEIQTHDAAGNVTCSAHRCDSVRVHAITTTNPCHASFHADTTAPNVSTGVYFYNASTGGSNTTQTYYTWSFGDSTFSHLANPVHAYPGAGTYHVCLTISTYGANGTLICSDDSCSTVTVVAPNPVPCHAAYQYTASTANPNELHFQEYASGSNLTYAWNFGDGHTGSGHDPVHTYSAAGYYMVCLTVTNASGGAVLCTDTHCDTIQVSAPTATHCSALFHYLQSTSVTNNVHFVNNSTGNHLNYHWSFGDGDSATTFDPGHTYSHAGTYYVCLTVVDYATNNIPTCTSQFCDSVTVGANTNPNPGPFAISGNVFNGPVNLSSNAIVYLITLDSFDLIAVDSVLAPQGQYAFSNVHNGQYLVKAALRAGANDYASFLPTYYGDQLFWLDGTLLTVNQGIASVDIHLQHGVNNSGPGFIGGNIFQGANKVGDPLTGYQVMVLNMDNTPVQYMYSDDKGGFNFSDLAYGTYKLYTEVLGLPTNAPVFTISPTSETGNANILVNTEIVTFEKLTGIETVGSAITGTSLFPNPVTSSATVRFNAANEGTVSISLTNIMGQQMMDNRLNTTAGSNEFSLDMAGMAPGIYILNIKDNNSKGAIFKIVKQ